MFTLNIFKDLKSITAANVQDEHHGNRVLPTRVSASAAELDSIVSANAQTSFLHPSCQNQDGRVNQEQLLLNVICPIKIDRAAKQIAVQGNEAVISSDHALTVVNIPTARYADFVVQAPPFVLFHVRNVPDSEGYANHIDKLIQDL